MVSATDLKVYRSTSDLGGAITGTQIPTATPNNLFTNVSIADELTGKTYYKCMYWKNTHGTEPMDDFKLWLSTGTPLDWTQVNFGFDPICDPRYPCIFFDGVNDYIDCTNDATLWSQSLTKFSISLWVFPTLFDATTRFVLAHDTGSNQRFQLHMNGGSAGNITFRIVNSAGTNRDAASSSLVLNQWNHVVAVYDNSLGSANVKVYVNTVVGGTTANETGAINLSAILKLSDSSTDFQGYMKDFRFWDSKALTQTEINNVNINSANAPDPDYHLLMSEGTGNPVDKASNTKVGTLTNGASWSTTAQTIANVNTSPVGVTWYGSNDTSMGSLGRISAGESFPTWVKLVVDSHSPNSVEDDSAIWTVNFDIPQTGTGDPGTGGTGGGTGGTPQTNADYKIAVFGDEGCEPETDNLINAVKGKYDMYISTGDHAYESAACWTGKFGVLKPNFHGAYGNHEYEESGGIGPYKTFFGDSNTHYSFKFQNILFIVIDSNDDKSGVDLDAQRTEVANLLTSVANDSTITWKIAVMHHPWFGTGAKHTANEFSQVEKFHKLFTDNKVSIVVTGHNHNWQRSKQVAFNPSNPRDSPSVVNGSSPFSRTAGGLIHVVSGTGGHDSGGGLYALPDPGSWQGYGNRTHNGFWEIVASNNGQTLTCSFVDNSGDKFDTFTYTA